MIYCQHNKDTNKISFEHIYIYIYTMGAIQTENYHLIIIKMSKHKIISHFLRHRILCSL